MNEHDRAWRDPAEVVAGWASAGEVDPARLASRARGEFWDVLARLEVTLLVGREYEHLLLALAAPGGRPRSTWLSLPHPSGIVHDAPRGVVHVASTRNPNQIHDLAPATGAVAAAGAARDLIETRPLVPIRSRFYPGSLYLHDLAIVGGELHGNAVGTNSIVRLPDGGGFEPRWWPRSVETARGPDLGTNHLQLNSIAAGRRLETSFYTASAERPGRRRPGRRDFPVDGRGVVFDGRTREPCLRGLTRPHSARLRAGRLWIANSGYGEVGVRRGGAFEPVVRLPGWTRGLAFAGDVAFAATSRILPRFHRYAPGLDPDRAVCGVHAIDVATGRVLGSLVWPAGDQIFALQPLPGSFTGGLPFGPRARSAGPRARALFYAYDTRPRRRR